MLEKMKTINNPLTIIGLFCGVVEVAGLIVTGTGNLAPEAQRDLIWLVKWFPVLLVSLFFVTLWFKDKALYAPGDFKDEKNYLALVKTNAKQSLGIEEIQAMIGEAIPKIVSEVTKTVSANGSEEKRKIEEIVQDKLQPVQTLADKLKWDYESDVSLYLSTLSDSDRRVALAVWRFLAAASKPTTLKEIASKLNLHEYVVSNVLHILIIRGVVKQYPDKESGITYSALALPNTHSFTLDIWRIAEPETSGTQANK